MTINWGQPVRSPNLLKGKRLSGIGTAEAEAERLRQAVLARMGKRGEALGVEAAEAEKGAKAAAGRGAVAATGRRSGSATGGGKMRALSGIGAGLERQVSEMRAKAAQKKYDHETAALGFERETMKSPEQMREETATHVAKVTEFRDQSSTLGVLNNEDFKRKVEDYIRQMALPTELANKMRAEADTLIKTEPWFW